MNYLLYYILKAEEEATGIKKWITDFFAEIGKECKDFFDEIVDIFKIFKEHTYDALSAKYGSTGVTLAFLTIGIILFMIIITVVIRGKE